jgi:hypothetical protein
VNREQRRRLSKLDGDVRKLMAASERDGKPWSIHGMAGACSDCSATASMHGQGRSSLVVAQIFHDTGCPASRGVVEWQPEPL